MRKLLRVLKTSRTLPASGGIVKLLQDAQLLSTVVQRAAEDAVRDFEQYAPALIGEGRDNATPEEELETFLGSLARVQLTTMAILDIARDTFKFSTEEANALMDQMMVGLMKEEQRILPGGRMADVVPFPGPRVVH